MSLRLALAVTVLVASLTATASLTAIAADPSPAPTGVLIDPLDPRAGAGANRIGAPLLALLVVVGLGVAAAALTAVYVRVVRTR